ncbi:hypothetical protein ERJ65_02945 [Lactobacillus helveticus]|uniref:Ribonuclease HI n=1 Tax=Lactobacillus helveticus TaxID=1587 RepID=A0AAV4E321_LACHE|nr:RNase H family protein [Lactobacillus helveticus]EGF35217.1 ribonuclease HI [Lactobacillus helveticus MTCC 5463]AJY61739.1 hypothetical protein HUO_07945 [Lactobacillus helveticus]KXN80048.1 hypothetical protein AY471_05085 [Lactobacillus helveticus]MBW7980744.1 hypothetical protein [Lactobacillus helveticus]MBW8000216.1 hypothetical protein [Lactobacillus helveticus]
MEKKYYVLTSKDSSRKVFYDIWDNVKKFPRKGIRTFDWLETMDQNRAEAEYFQEHGYTHLEEEIEKRKKNLQSDEAIIFTDGSHQNKNLKYVGFAAIIITAEDETQLKGCSDNSGMVKHANVSGEISAVEMAVSWAKRHGLESLYIYHDYKELKGWVDNNDHTKTDISGDYVKFINQQRDNGMKIEFTRVPGHRGFKDNERVDKLAQAAIPEPNEDMK